MSTHTPIPWEVLPGPHAGGLPIRGADRLITEVTGGSSYPEMQANAAFIIRAVNNHAQLLAALEEIAEGSANADHSKHCHQWRRIARKAIRDAQEPPAAT